MMRKITSALPGILFGMAICGQVVAANSTDAEQPKLIQKTETWSVALGATRIIYLSGSDGESIRVKNPNTYPVLVQSNVMSEDQKPIDRFLVTPPLFRLDAGQETRITLQAKSAQAVLDREVMSWLCVTGIPPKDGDEWAKNKELAIKTNSAVLDVKVKLARCVKVLERPEALKEGSMSSAEKVSWAYNGNTLTATNPTPYYISFGNVLLDGIKMKGVPGYIPPFGKKDYTQLGKKAMHIQWRAVDDLGGETKQYDAFIK